MYDAPSCSMMISLASGPPEHHVVPLDLDRTQAAAAECSQLLRRGAAAKCHRAAGAYSGLLIKKSRQQ